MTKKKYPLRWVYPEKPITPKEGRNVLVMGLPDNLIFWDTWGNHGKLGGDARGLRGEVTRLKGWVEQNLTGFTGAGDRILEGDVTGLTGDIEQYIDPDSDDGRYEVAEHLSGSGAWLGDDYEDYESLSPDSKANVDAGRTPYDSDDSPFKLPRDDDDLED